MLWHNLVRGTKLFIRQNPRKKIVVMRQLRKLLRVWAALMQRAEERGCGGGLPALRSLEMRLRPSPRTVPT